MDRDDRVFLEYASRYCAEYPSVIPQLTQVLTQAITTRLESEREKRAEIEAALAVSLSRKSKSGNAILAAKLEKIKEYGMFGYDATIKELKGDS